MTLSFELDPIFFVFAKILNGLYHLWLTFENYISLYIYRRGNNSDIEIPDRFGQNYLIIKVFGSAGSVSKLQ